MIKIPLEKIIEKIKKEANLPEEEIHKKIEEKLKQLAGLISREGAAHIVANELGVKLFEQFSGKLQIKNILSGMRDVETVGKVMQLFDVREFESNGRKGKVGSALIGDETGTIRVVMWGDQADKLKEIQPGNILKVLGGYVKDNSGKNEIHLNDRSGLFINPAGVTVGDVKTATNARKKIKELSHGETDVELLGTVVQVFDIRFFETCPECFKRVRQLSGAFTCEKHGNVNPNYSYVFNLLLDDGSDTIRVVFFRNQVQKLLTMSQEDILKFKEDPQGFEQVKTGLLGNIVKIVGKVNKNEMFDRLEFVSQLVYPKPNPEEEIKRLSKGTESKAESVIEEI